MVRKFETALDTGKSLVMAVNALAQSAEHGKNLALELFDARNSGFHVRHIQTKLGHLGAKMTQDVEHKILGFSCHVMNLSDVFRVFKACIIALPRPK